jgi:hypothetical protein
MSDIFRASLLGLAILPAADSISAADRLHLLDLATEPAASASAPVTGTRQVMFASTGLNAGSGTSRFCLFNGRAATIFENEVQVPAAAAGVLRNWKITLTTAPGVGASRIFTIRKAGADTAMQITISGTSVSEVYTAADLVVAAGDLLNIRHTVTGTPANSGAWNWSIEFEGTTPHTSIYGGSCGTHNNDDIYMAALGADVALSTSLNHGNKSLAACAGTMTALYVRVISVGSYTAYLNKNGVRQDGSGGTVDTSVALAGTGVFHSTFSLSVAPSDLLHIEMERNSGSGGWTTVATCFLASTPGQFQICGGIAGNALPTGATEYESPVTRNLSWNATEDTRGRNLAGAITPFTLSGLQVALENAPGSGGDAWTFTTRKNEADTTLATTIANAATENSDGVNSVDLVSSDRWAFKVVPAVTPASGTDAIWSWIGGSEPEEVPGGGGEVPPGVNPDPGDPVGAIYFARIVHTGDQVVLRGECTIRDPADHWEGKKPSGLLKVGKVSLRAVKEGIPTAECTIELDDTPDPITGACFWRALAAEGPLEGAFVEVFRCHAPYGIIIGTPWRYFAGRVPEGGHYPIEGFRYGFRFVDPLGELFDDPRFRVPIPGEPLTLAQFAGMLERFDGKVPPLVLGNCVTDGEGVVRMIPMGRINILAAFGSGLNLEVGVGLIARQAVYDVVEGYYNILTWEAEKVVFLGEERRPTIENPGYGFVFRVTVAGTTDNEEPIAANGNAWPTSVGGTVTDGTVTWMNVGVDDVTSRRRIPNEMYGVAGGLAVPHKPGWSAVTGLSTQHVIYGAPNRVYTPVLWDLSHPYSPYVESGQIELLWDVVGAMSSATSGTPILNPVYLFIHLLLNYGWAQTDGLAYEDMPMVPGLTGDYSVFDMDSADVVKTAHDALGGMVNGFEIAPEGEPEDLWSVLNRIQKFGRFHTFKNRHGQICFAVKDATATPTLVFDEQRDQITVKERVSTDQRGIGVEFRYGKRYVPHVPAATANPGQPVRSVSGFTKGDWASGLNELTHPAAAAAIATSYGRDRTRPIKLDIDTTRDGPTALLVAEFARDEGAGPGPSYDGVRVFEFTGPFERVLLREGTDGKTLLPGACIAITNAEGMAAAGYVDRPAFVIEVEPDAETDRARVVVEILDEVP